MVAADAAKKSKRSTVSFPVVGIGASAGGLDACRRFLGAVAPDCGMAFVLIQHLDPTRESLTVDLVATYTKMLVTQAQNGDRLQPNRVYVIPPNKYLSLHGKTLEVSPPTQPRGSRMAIDYFLQSLAATCGARGIGVILSGSGTDGTLGLIALKSAGGTALVQDPATAQHDGMPRSAIASGSVDLVLPPEQLADALCAPVLKSDRKALAGDGVQLERIVALLQEQTKFDFAGYKEGTLQRRVFRRMSLMQIARMNDYVEHLRSDPAEVDALQRDLLISVTSFFRDPDAWRVLQERVLRKIVAAKNSSDTIRAWVPACATGEEAYTLVMLLLEEVEAAGKSCRLQVFASDVDAEALEVAREGDYGHEIATQLSAERLSRFFTVHEDGYRVRKTVRDLVVFTAQNVLVDPPFSRLDLICCRNLLIYFEPALQERVVGLLHFGLVKGGYLFLGSAEGIGVQGDAFDVVSKKWRIFRRAGPPRRSNLRLSLKGLTEPVVPGSRPLGAATHPGRLATLVRQMLLERFAPPCVIISREGEILYFHGKIDEVLVHPTGLPTRDLIAKVRSGLRTKLREAVQESLRLQRRVVVNGVPVRGGVSAMRLNITVEPLAGTREVEGLWMVAFERASEAAAVVPAETRSGDDSTAPGRATLKQLEHDLRASREDLEINTEDLRATNEELLAVNEELQSSNAQLETSEEELMSVNEELQSSNEELETSKEELQSLNEELITANSDLENKIGELQASNSDLDNLLTSTNIATLFLDAQLRIRRYTSAASRLFSLIPADVGRPISDITPKFTDATLLADISTALERGQSPTAEVQSHEGQWFVRQVLPYRAHDGQTDGVVITFSDVAAEALHEARDYAESIVDTVREPLLVLDRDMRVHSANRSFYATFRLAPVDTIGKSLYFIGGGCWDIAVLREVLAGVLNEKRVINDFKLEREFEAIGRRSLLLNARAILGRGERSPLILLAIDDITERKNALQALRESEAVEQSESKVRQRQAELAHALRISTIGEMASNLSHELNQPLSSIANGVEACARYVRSGTAKPAKLLALLEEASAEALRAGSIVEHLRSFISKRESRFEAADLREIARGIPRLLGRELRQERITFQLDTGARSLPILADRIQIEQIIINLIQNAIDAMRGMPAKAKRIQLHTGGSNGMAECSVSDSGTGLPADATERLFEPFFTTKAYGLGMGLAICRSIIEAHQGRIWVECPTDDNRGTTLCFSLPLVTPPAKSRSI